MVDGWWLMGFLKGYLTYMHRFSSKHPDWCFTKPTHLNLQQIPISPATCPRPCGEWLWCISPGAGTEAPRKLTPQSGLHDFFLSVILQLAQNHHKIHSWKNNDHLRKPPLYENIYLYMQLKNNNTCHTCLLYFFNSNKKTQKKHVEKLLLRGFRKGAKVWNDIDQAFRQRMYTIDQLLQWRWVSWVSWVLWLVTYFGMRRVQNLWNLQDCERVKDGKEIRMHWQLKKIQAVHYKRITACI